MPKLGLASGKATTGAVQGQWHLGQKREGSRANGGGRPGAPAPPGPGPGPGPAPIPARGPCPFPVSQPAARPPKLLSTSFTWPEHSRAFFLLSTSFPTCLRLFPSHGQPNPTFFSHSTNNHLSINRPALCLRSAHRQNLFFSSPVRRVPAFPLLCLPTCVASLASRFSPTRTPQQPINNHNVCRGGSHRLL